MLAGSTVAVARGGARPAARGARGRSRSRRAGPCGRCWPPAPPTSRRRWARPGRCGGRRHQARRHPDPGAPRRRRRAWSHPESSTTSPTGCRRWSRSPGRCRRRRSCSTARRSRSATTAGRDRSRRPALAHRETPRRRAADAVLLRRAARRRRRPARRPAAAPPRRARRRGPDSGCPGWSPPTPPRAEAFFADVVAAGQEGVVVKAARRALRGRPARRRVGQGQAGAHPRPGRAGGRVGLAAAARAGCPTSTSAPATATGAS